MDLLLLVCTTIFSASVALYGWHISMVAHELEDHYDRLEMLVLLHAQRLARLENRYADERLAQQQEVS